MALSKTRKDELVAQYKALVEDSDGIFFTEYTGMTVKEMQGLRSNLRSDNGTYAVTKNTLLKLALAECGRPVPEDLLIGQTGAGFALGDAPPIAKALTEYAKEDEKFIIKGAILGDKLLSPEEVEALAKLPSLDQLRATILGLVQAPARDIASVVASGMRQVVNVIDAYSKEGAESADSAA